MEFQRGSSNLQSPDKESVKHYKTSSFLMGTILIDVDKDEDREVQMS
jgi:hypothetical protein